MNRSVSKKRVRWLLLASMVMGAFIGYSLETRQPHMSSVLYVKYLLPRDYPVLRLQPQLSTLNERSPARANDDKGGKDGKGETESRVITVDELRFSSPWGKPTEIEEYRSSFYSLKFANGALLHIKKPSSDLVDPQQRLGRRLARHSTEGIPESEFEWQKEAFQSSPDQLPIIATESVQGRRYAALLEKAIRVPAQDLDTVEIIESSFWNFVRFSGFQELPARILVRVYGPKYLNYELSFVGDDLSAADIDHVLATLRTPLLHP